MSALELENGGRPRILVPGTMRLSTPFLVCLAARFSGCSTLREGTDNSAVQTQAAQEIHRICALPESEQAVQIRKGQRPIGRGD